MHRGNSVVYNKPMIDLVREIRLRVPGEHKPSVKLANPELLSLVIEIYQQSSDNVLKALMRELLSMAGPPWPERLMHNDHSKNDYQVKVYRGQAQLVEKKDAPVQAAKRKIIYRGQVVQ
ncbi:hypothetical protein SAMN02745866_00422 [Alteromonadaceae bacterium Bs31]|nr:hypothetical protein SAMN02745866_00422 [Alteromonadaceae bacterium Bs31]